MKRLLLLTSLLVVALPSAHAVEKLSADDFYCYDIPLSKMEDGKLKPAPPVIYDLAARNCGGVTEATRNLCVMYARCVYINDEFKNDVKQVYKGKSFDELSPSERGAAVVKLQADVTPRNAMLNCPAKKKLGQFVCPIPQNCKRDVIFTKDVDSNGMLPPPQTAAFDPDDVDSLTAGIKNDKVGFRPFSEPEDTNPSAGSADSQPPTPKR